MKYVFVYFVLMVWVVISAAESHASDRQTRMQNQVYESFVKGDIPLWERTIREMDRVYQSAGDVHVLYDLLIARYGFIAFSLENDEAIAREHLDMAEDELDILFGYQYYQADAYALQGAFLGFRISLRPISGIRLGPRSYRSIDKAREADPENPIAWMETGNSLFYTPSAFGGSKEEARDAYRKAIALFEKDMKNNHRWLYLNSLVGLARSYSYVGTQQQVIDTYRKALRFEPDFKWVRDELLPEALK